MWSITWSNLRFHPLRFAATALSIVIGVAFFVGTGVLTSTVRGSLNETVTGFFDNVDASVRSSQEVGVQTGFGALRPKISVELADQIATVPGVADASPSLSGYAQVVGSDGKVLDGPSVGLSWSGSEQSSEELVAGRAPAAPNEIAIDRGSFDEGGFALGETVRVLPLPADQPATLVGVFEHGSATVPNDTRLVAFDFDGATALWGTDVDQILVVADPGVSQEQLVADLAEHLPPDIEAVTGSQLGDELSDIISDVTAIINTALQVFAFIALGVGVFIVYNTFTVIVAQRLRELALLRSIGATGRQVRRAVMLEALVLGLVASALGVVVGIGVGWVLVQFVDTVGFDLGGRLDLPISTILSALVIGAIVTVGSAWFPARRAGHVAPLALLRDAAASSEAISRRRLALGLAFVAVAVAEIVRALGPGGAWDLAVAALVMIVAVLVLGPWLATPLAALVGLPFGRRVTTEMAVDNATRNPKRTATTSAALLIGVMLIVAATVFTSSLSASMRDELEDTLRADLVVEADSTAQMVGGGLSPDVTGQLRSVEGVDVASPIFVSFGIVDGEFAEVTGVDPETISRVLDVREQVGSLADLGASASIAVTTEEAERLGLGIGDSVAVQLGSTAEEHSIVAILEDGLVLAGWAVSAETLEAAAGPQLVAAVLIQTDGDPSAIRAEVDRVVAENPIARVKTKGKFIDEQASQIDVMLYVLYGLLGVSVLVALVGIVNTLGLAVTERTREIGLLRAVGMTRRQIRSTIRYEAAIVALIGTAQGVILGLLMGWLGSRAVNDVFPVFSIPWVTVMSIAAVGVLCGVVAGVLPARRAARLDILEAIATE